MGSGLEKGRAVEVGEEPVTIGSGTGTALTLSDPDVAALHASVRRGPGGEVELVPLDDAAPVLVDGEPVSEPRAVRAGQTIAIGGVEITLRDQAPADPDPDMSPDLAEALGSDGPRADDELTPLRERRRVRRATVLAAAALGLATVAGVLALTGVLGGDDDRPDVAALVRDVTPSTVRVIAREAGQEASGSGWVLDARAGLVVTNFHVVNGASRFAVAVEGAERDARLVGAAPCDDLAVVRVSDRSGLRSLPLAEDGTVEQGEPVVAVGYAVGAGESDRLTATAGVVSVASQPLRSPSPDAPDFPDVVQTDAAINPGNSGGPLLDEERRVVGVNTAVLLQRGGVPLQNIGYAIGAGRVREVVRDLRRRRSLSWLGTGLEFPPRRELRSRGLPPGVVTLSAVPGTPADEAGLRGRSVVVTEVDDHELTGTMPDYCSATSGRRTGDRATLQVVSRRNGRPRRLALPFG